MRTRDEPPGGHDDDWFEAPSWAEDDAPTTRRRAVRPGPPESRPVQVDRARAFVAGLGVLLILGVVIAAVALAIGDDGDEADPIGPTQPVATQPTGTEPAATATETAPATEPAGEAVPPLPTGETLRPGASGPVVTQLQEALAALGFDPGSVDGSYGPGTTQAVRNFQQREGLPADGIAGPQTLEAINRALTAG